jgi:hypothetical protein
MTIRQGTHRRRKVKSDGRDGNEKMGLFTRHYGGPRRIELASYQFLNHRRGTVDLALATKRDTTSCYAHKLDRGDEWNRREYPTW